MLRFSLKQSVMQESGSGVVTKEKPEPFPIYSSPFPSLSHLSFPSPCHPFSISSPPFPSYSSSHPGAALRKASSASQTRADITQLQTSGCNLKPTSFNSLFITFLNTIPAKKPFMLTSIMGRVKSNTIAHIHTVQNMNAATKLKYFNH